MCCSGSLDLNGYNQSIAVCLHHQTVEGLTANHAHLHSGTRLSIDCIRLDQESQNSTLRLQIEQDKNGNMNVELNVNALGKALQRLDESFKR
jgi:hypothetical protein